MLAALDEPFTLTAAVLAVAALAGLAANRARQPLIVAFIAVGVAVGPSALGWVADAEPLELLAEIGIAVLLFLVGLKLDLHLVRTTGKVALITGIGQVAFTSIVGFGIAMALGLSAQVAIYVAVALTFSSTIIIVKLLSDKRELEQLHGRIALGFLIVQDVVVVIAMIVLATIGGDRGGSVPAQIGLIAAQGIGILVVLGGLMRWVLPRVLRVLATSQELLIISAIAWAVVIAAFCDQVGFSVEVGAFLAGFSVASTPYRESIASSLSGVRDFLLLFFFIELGAQLDLSAIGSQVPTALVLSAFVLIGNPLIVLVLMGSLGYPRRVSFLAGLAVAQISEFSLILITLGRELGHVGDDAVGLVTLVGLITIAASTYLILYSGPVFDRLSGALRIFERREIRIQEEEQAHPAEIIVYGFGRFGRHLVDNLVEDGRRVLVIDWDPLATGHAEHGDLVEVRFGDADDPEFPGSLPLAGASAVVSTIPDVATNKTLVRSLRRWGAEGRVLVTAHTTADAARYDTEVDDGSIDRVLLPFEDAAGRASDVLRDAGT